jgi:hypothetical protein
MNNLDATELYPELDTSTYRQAYQHPSAQAPKRTSRLRRTIGTGLLAGALTALSILSPGCDSRPTTPTPIVTPTPTQTTPTPTVTVDPQQQYRSQITQYLKQDVPALVQDAKSFNYAVDRLALWGTPGVQPVSVDYQSIRAPLVKWIDANISWQNKGERLYPMSEVDFLTDELFNPVMSNEWGSDKTKYPAYFQNSVNYLVENHDALWNEIRNPDKMKKHFDFAMGWINSNLERSPGSLEIAKVYENAIWEKGTGADRISYATYGYVFTHLQARKFADSGEGARMDLVIPYLASIGGEAQFSDMMFDTGGHQEPSMKISSKLEAEYKNNPQIYGTKLDSGYLTVPYSAQGAEAMAATQIAKGLPKMLSVERYPNFKIGYKPLVLWKK